MRTTTRPWEKSGTVGLLKKGPCAFHRRGGQNAAGGSYATADVADGRFCMSPHVGSEVGFFNGPTVTYYGSMSRRGMTRWSSFVHRESASAAPVGQCVHRSEPLAVSRKPMALPDALSCELYCLTEDGIRIVGKESSSWKYAR